MLELCRVTTSDGLTLDGSLTCPADSPPKSTALLLIHGTGSNFYSGGILATLGEHAVACRSAVLRMNTRGHDQIAMITGPNGPVKGGAAYEQVLDCRLDVSAWCDFLVERGYAQIVLIGHSLGGVKAIWSQAMLPHSAVIGVVGISPPRFVHERFQTDPRCEPFRSSFAEARQLVAAGEPDRLISVKQPLPLVITAANFLDKYGPHDPLDYLPPLKQLTCPRLIVVGSQSVETNAAFAELPDALEAAAASDGRLQSAVIPGADINFRNDPTQPWQKIREWMEEL